MGLRLEPMPSSIEMRKEIVMKKISGLAEKSLKMWSHHSSWNSKRSTVAPPPPEVKFMNAKDAEQFR